MLTKSNLPVADCSANPCAGCEHAGRDCCASFREEIIPSARKRRRQQAEEA